MRNTVSMNAIALRGLMGDHFDFEQFDQGRKDARDFFRNHHEEREVKIEEIKQILQNGDYRHRPRPEYWIGCLSEADFIF